MIFIFGNGKHSMVIREILYNNKFVQSFNSIPINIDKEDEEKYQHNEQDLLIHGIGDNRVRKILQTKKYAFGIWPSIIAKDVICNDSVILRPGCQILHKACVLTGSVIGEGTIIETGAQIDHDCQVGNYCLISGGVTFGGSVTIGDDTLIGVGVTICPDITIGKGCVILDTGPIHKDIPDFTVLRYKD